MGGCISTSSHSSSSSSSSGAKVSSSCFGLVVYDQKRTFSDHVVSFCRSSSTSSRIVNNGKTPNSCIFTQQGRKGINQDAMIVWEDFMSGDVTFCGVFDGHGPHGHLVARKVRDVLPRKLVSFLLSSQSNQKGSGRNCFRQKSKNEEEQDSDFSASAEDKSNSIMREVFLKAYKSMDKELRSHPNLDCFCSGSTAVTIIKQGSNLFIGNIGDSRAILGSKGSDESMVAIQLTVDLKPDLPREAERIKQCNGRVFALQDEPEVPRVWLPFDDAPGLAMARAFGDFCLKEYGVISIPEFAHRTLTNKDQFIVLATDGVWDVLSNEEVVQIVSTAPARSSAARTLVEKAACEWKLKYPTSKMDDCAVVCLFLDGKMDSESDYDEHSSSSILQTDHSGHDTVESDGTQKNEPTFQRNQTVRSSEDVETYEKSTVDVQEPAVAEDQNWSGLEGVTRVNSLVQLPRFSEEAPKP